MTHTMPIRLRRFFLKILPPLLWMESPKLREKLFEYELTTVNNIEQAVILQNPCHKLDETISDDRRIKSKYMNQVIFYKILRVIKV
jgi:hypothetical protein